MKKLYVIVHEGKIDEEIEGGIKKAIAVKKYIKKVKKKYQFLEIVQYKDPRKLHPKMPKSSSDLKVIVVGAFTELCISKQKKVLKEKGYNVRIEGEGCLKWSDD